MSSVSLNYLRFPQQVPLLPSIVNQSVGFFPFELSVFDALGNGYSLIYKVPFGGGSIVQVTSDTTNFNVAGNPVVSPDFSKVAYLKGTDSPATSSRLHVCDADGSNDLNLVASNSCFTPNWSPDGTKILFKRSGSIYTIQPDGTNLTTVTTRTNVVGGWFNRDGTKVAYYVDPANPTANEVWVVNADGTSDTKIVANAGTGGVIEIAWEAGADVLVYGKNGDLYKINYDGTGNTQISTGINSTMSFRSMGPSDTDLFVTDATGALWTLNRAPLAATGVSAVSPTVNPDKATQRGVPMVADGRVYTIVLASGTQNLISILPDGSDRRTEYIVVDPTVERIFLRNVP